MARQTRSITIVALSPRRRRVTTAPANNNTAPEAASGTRTGAMPSAAGRIRPTAPRNSRTPMALRAPGLKSSTHLVAAPMPASFSLGTNILALLPSKTTASSPATIHSATFRRFLLVITGFGPPSPRGHRPNRCTRRHPSLSLGARPAHQEVCPAGTCPGAPGRRHCRLRRRVRVQRAAGPGNCDHRILSIPQPAANGLPRRTGPARRIVPRLNALPLYFRLIPGPQCG